MKTRLFTDKNIARIGNFVDDHVSSVSNLENDIPPFSSVEISINGACNRRCVFCPRVNEKDYPNILESLNMEAFKNLVKDLVKINYTGRFSFSGFCEPLLTKNLDEYIYEIKMNLPKTTIEIVSNGDVLLAKNGESVLKKLYNSGLDTIRISLYDGPHQTEIFKKLKEKISLSDKQFMLRERFLGSDKSFGLTISNRAGSVNLKTDHFELKPLKEPLKNSCYYPFYKVLIDHDGTVLMCSNDWKKEKPLGNIINESLLAIWSNSEFIKVRKKLSQKDRNYKPCNVCSINGTLNGKISFNRWEEYFLKNESY